MAASAAAVILAGCGHPRQAVWPCHMPASCLHQPLRAGLKGQASDIEIQARLRRSSACAEQLNQILARSHRAADYEKHPRQTPSVTSSWMLADAGQGVRERSTRVLENRQVVEDLPDPGGLSHDDHKPPPSPLRHPGRRAGAGRQVGTAWRSSATAVSCSSARFCGKSQKQVKKLIAGPGVYICDECIDLCNEIIEEEFSTESSDDHLRPSCRSRP